MDSVKQFFTRLGKAVINFIVKMAKRCHLLLKKLVVVLLIFIVIFSVLSYFGTTDYETESALMGDAIASTTFNGVFIRDEEVITYDGNGSICYGVPDGGRLGTGSVIAEIYTSDSQILVNKQLDKLSRELEILKKIQNPGTTEAAQPLHLSSLIEESYRNITYNRELKNYDALEEEKENLLVTLSTYQIVTDSSTDFSQRISELNAEIAQLKSSSALPSNTIVSDRSAYFVSYCDGYETRLTKENVNALSIADIKAVEDTKDNSNTIVGKIIDGYSWYLAGIVDNSKGTYEIGDSVKLRFESSSEKFNAVITDIRDEGNPEESIVILSCDEFNYDLIQHRCERSEIINGEFSGLKVPRDAIRFQDITETVTDDESGITTQVTTNYKGVNIVQGEQIVFKKIDVIYEGREYVLSALNDDSDYLSLYDDIVVRGVGSDEK